MFLYPGISALANAIDIDQQNTLIFTKHCLRNKNLMQNNKNKLSK